MPTNNPSVPYGSEPITVGANGAYPSGYGQEPGSTPYVPWMYPPGTSQGGTSQATGGTGGSSAGQVGMVPYTVNGQSYYYPSSAYPQQQSSQQSGQTSPSNSGESPPYGLGGVGGYDPTNTGQGGSPYFPGVVPYTHNGQTYYYPSSNIIGGNLNPNTPGSPTNPGTGTGGTGGTGTGGTNAGASGLGGLSSASFWNDPAIASILNPAPYNAQVARGQKMIGSVPGSFPQSSSPAFRNMYPAQLDALNSQYAQQGLDSQNQAALEFARMHGTEVPQFQLNQLLGLAGLQPQYANLENQVYGNQVQAGTSSLNSLLGLLGAFL